MGAEPKRKGKNKPAKAPRNTTGLKRGGSKGKKRVGRRDYENLVFSYFEFRSKERAAIYAGFSPSSATFLFRHPTVVKLLEELRPLWLKVKAEKAAENFAVTNEFLDTHLVHEIVNGPTHFVRGRADVVKAIEVGYKRTGAIQPMRIVNNAQAAAVAGVPPGTPMRATYKALWLIEKENEMRKQCEREYEEQRQLEANNTPPDTAPAQ